MCPSPFLAQGQLNSGSPVAFLPSSHESHKPAACHLQHVSLNETAAEGRVSLLGGSLKEQEVLPHPII